MASKEDKGAKKEEPKDYCTRVLLNEDEWQDPACRRVLSEYHKEGLKDMPPNVEPDLDAFDDYWRKKGAINIKSEYHKEGAPYFENPDVWEEHGARPTGEAKVPPPPAPMPKAEQQTLPQGEARVFRKSDPRSPPKKEPLDRSIDIAGLEVIAYALVRFIFGTGVHIPIKREGMVDMDVTVKRKDIIVNTNQFYVSLPELSVWKVVYTHKDKPVLEYGRGVKNSLKIHKFNAIMLLIELWQINRESRKLKEAAAKAAAQAEGGPK